MAKSREAALAAVQIFNNPLIRFKSETFIVLMVIAWTYLLHAYFRSKGIEYRYFEQRAKRRRFKRTRRGAFRYWELDRCLEEKSCPLDAMTVKNLQFLIGLRNEIEHQMTLSLDNYLSSRYQACCLNYNSYVKKLFGAGHGIERYLTYSLQFVELSHEQAAGLLLKESVPPRLAAYIADFDGALTHEEFNSPQFAYRLLFKRKLVGRAGQADRVVEFIDPASDLAKQIDKEYWVQKEVEKPKFRPKQIVDLMQQEGFRAFGMQRHTELWKSLNAKEPGKGFGHEVAGTWFWYESWINVVRQHCVDNAKLYGKNGKST